MTAPRALIAEDEPLLAAALEHALRQVWPDLHIVATVGDGISAVEQALALRPDVLFFDIRMPGQTGLEAAAQLADAWPADLPFPALVLVTAYEQYAVQAFEAQAVDYLLKPIQTARLQKTVHRLQQLRQQPLPATPALDATVEQLRQLLAVPGLASAIAVPPPRPLLTVIQASSGPHLHLVPVSDVLYFEAADKYVRVLTAEREFLIRTPLKELAAQLDSEIFWQVHRAVLVRASAIATVMRDEAGRLHLQLRQRPEKLTVSRLYAHRFKAM